MGGFGESGYEARTVEELFNAYLNSVEAEYGDDLEPYQGSFARSLFRGFARAVAENQEADLEDLYDSMFVSLSEGDELTMLAKQYGVRRQPAIRATGVVEWTRSTTGTELVVPSGTEVQTEAPDAITFETTESATFGISDTTSRANIQAVEPGTRGNVGADRIVVMPSPPAGVSGVTNPQPTGDPEYTLTNDSTQQTLGQDRESDESIRDRVLEGASIGGSATVRAVRDAVRALGGAPSLAIYTNRTTTDNANGNGLPKLSVELVIYSPSVTDKEVAEAIHETVSIGERLTSGHNGTAVSYNVQSEVLEQTRTVEWSEPNKTTLSITVDVAEEDGYAGDTSVRSEIASYIGGTLPDGSPVAGLDVSEDVIVDELERRISSVQGVLGVASVTIDATGDGTDDTTTRSDGLQAYEVSSNEVASVDATSDITVN
jgi:uncharacterized phage protein gp47/JayE